jgi:hypothetical protein
MALIASPELGTLSVHTTETAVAGEEAWHWNSSASSARIPEEPKLMPASVRPTPTTRTGPAVTPGRPCARTSSDPAGVASVPASAIGTSSVAVPPGATVSTA